MYILRINSILRILIMNFQYQDIFCILLYNYDHTSESEIILLEYVFCEAVRNKLRLMKLKLFCLENQVLLLPVSQSL